MKKNLLTLLSLTAGLFAFGQTATNFNCNDCAGVNHDLFSELNAGKVVVICWVMPCSSCISGALAAQSACNAYASSNPGQVLYYCVDDYANTSCSTLSGWCTTNGVNPTAKFSNAAINMSNYGSAGMPKVVVLGDVNHTVYYNQNNAAITTSGIQAAIGNALAAIATGVQNIDGPLFQAQLFPNPVDESATLSLNLAADAKVSVLLTNLLGEKMGTLFTGNLPQGRQSISIKTDDLAGGNYFITISGGGASSKLKLVVVH